MGRVRSAGCGITFPFTVNTAGGISVTGTGCRSIMIAKILIRGRNNPPGHRGQRQKNSFYENNLSAIPET